WVTMPSPASSEALFAVRGRAYDDAYVAGSSGLLMHWNGSEWDEINAPSSLSFFAVATKANGELWISGAEGMVYRRGASSGWQTFDTNNDESSLYALGADPAGGIWVGGSEGQIFTFNG